nr:diacylglycerol kinase [Inmirania thermothiophila]
MVLAFGHSLRGLRAAWRDEEAFQLEVAAAVVLLPAAFWLGRDGTERALLAGSVLLVPLVELLNSAVEATVDRIGTEHHPLAGQAKDLGSAAVLVALLLAAAVWAAVLWPA